MVENKEQLNMDSEYWRLFFEIHKDMPRQGAGRNEYTKKAFEMIPRLHKPQILDIGCGPGMQTITLAQLSGGEVIGIDIVQQYLDQFEELIRKEHLEDRVKAVNQSMMDMHFPAESFDIIWSEGSIFIIGFEKGLIEWKRYLKPQGYLALHDIAWTKEDPPREIKDFWDTVYPNVTTIQQAIKTIRKCGYTVIDHFVLPEDAWWEFYYKPLENRLDLLKKKYASDQKVLDILSEEQMEIEMFRKYHEWYGSVFYVLQKRK